MTRSAQTDDRAFTDLNTEEKLAVLTLRALEDGVAPHQVRTIIDRVIDLNQAVDAELGDALPKPKAYGHLTVMK